MGELLHRALAESLHLHQEFGGTGVLQSLAVFLLLPRRRCFCRAQRDKGVADALIEAHKRS